MPGSSGLDSLVRNIGIISRNNSVLASMLSHLAAGDDAEPRELRVLLQDTGLIARETGELSQRRRRASYSSPRTEAPEDVS